MSVESITNALRSSVAAGRLTVSDVRAVVDAIMDGGEVTREEFAQLNAILGRAASLGVTWDGRYALERLVDHLGRRFAESPRATAVPLLPGNIDPGPFSAKKTNLGKFSHGEFDVEYVPQDGEVRVLLKLSYQWEDGISGAEKDELQRRVEAAVGRWDGAAYLRTLDLALNPIIYVRFQTTRVNSGEHFVVDVDEDERREFVAIQINVWKGTSTFTLTHELGHCFGNYDEYHDTGVQAWFERRMYWHDNDYLDDEEALMNSGSGFRTRYFNHFESWVNRHFNRLGIRYEAFLRT
jgi:hypothetical protein